MLNHQRVVRGKLCRKFNKISSQKLWSGWWCNNHLEKWWSSSMGLGRHPRYEMENNPFHGLKPPTSDVFQSFIFQVHIYSIYIYIPYILHIIPYIFHIYSIYIPYIYIFHYIPYIFHIYSIYIYIPYIYIPYIFHIYSIYIPYIFHIYSIYWISSRKLWTWSAKRPGLEVDWVVALSPDAYVDHGLSSSLQIQAQVPRDAQSTMGSWQGCWAPK